MEKGVCAKLTKGGGRCFVFCFSADPSKQALVWSTSQRIRYLRGERPPPPGGINGLVTAPNGINNHSHHHAHHPMSGSNGHHHQAVAVGTGASAAVAVAGGGGGGGVDGGVFFVEDGGGKAAVAAAGGLRMSAVFGDALAEAFRRRPFARFLEALKCITKELPALGRCVVCVCACGRAHFFCVDLRVPS